MSTRLSFRVWVNALGNISVMPRGYILDDPDCADSEALDADWIEVGLDYARPDSVEFIRQHNAAV